MSNSENYNSEEEYESGNESCKNEDEVTIEVDWEGELICALYELRNVRKENKILKELLLQHVEEAKEAVSLRAQVEEAKRIQESLAN